MQQDPQQLPIEAEAALTTEPASAIKGEPAFVGAPHFVGEVGAAPVGGRGRSRIGTRRKVIGAVIAGACALALVVGFLVWVQADGPDDVVRAYLTAILDRKVDQALRIARVDRPAGESGTFLTAKALVGGWRIDSTKVRNDFDDEAEVAITLADTSSQPTFVPDRLWGTFKLTRTGGGWRITNPFVKAAFLDSPLWYVEVGGARVARDHYPIGLGGGTDPQYLVFPGIYPLYAGHSDLVTVPPTKLFALPGNGAYLTNNLLPALSNPRPTVTDRANRLFRQASDAALDECLAEQTKPDQGCLLNLADIVYRTSQGYVMKSDVQTSTWKVVRYPAVNLAGPQNVFSKGLEVFSGQVTIPGELQLTATGLALDGRRPVSFTMTCLVTGESLVAAIKADDSLSTTWQVGPTLTDEPPHRKTIDLRCY